MSATMDSFHQQTYTAEPQWEYPDMEGSFVPVAQGMTYFHPPGHAAYPIEQLSGTAFAQYMPQQSDAEASEVPLFQTPRLPASEYPVATARRPVRREHVGAEEGDRREKIRRTRTVRWSHLRLNSSRLMSRPGLRRMPKEEAEVRWQ